MLDGFRVLDLTDEKGYLCGRILADLGADVIKVEKPEGDDGRRKPPFHEMPGQAAVSLYWLTYNLNKRGITLDIQKKAGRQEFIDLVCRADCVLESFPVGYMERLNLGYSALSEANPRIIMTSISPFGQTGPYKDYLASDINCMAMSGYRSLFHARNQ